MNQSAIAQLNPLDRSAIERIVALWLARVGAELKLFGSRARGDVLYVSDIDLALVAKQPIAAADMAMLREPLEESTVPFRIELIDYASAPTYLRAAIDREGISWPVQTSA